jgi:hypothetical protein
MKLAIEYKSKFSRIKNIEKRNKAFNNLSDEDKRKEIAWDALQLVLNDTVKPANGYYWSPNIYNIRLSLNIGDSKGLQEALLNVPECSVCARGAVMLSQIRLGNELAPEIAHIDRGGSYILKGFSIYSMEEMEREYEHSDYYHPYICNTKEKLVNILCNVIANGDFNNEDNTDYIK